MKLFKTLFDLATLPIAITQDILTLGGVVTEKKGGYIGEKIKELDEDLEA